MNGRAQAAAERAASITTPSDREILTERTFDAPRERVWRAFTDPELIPRWWGLRSTSTIVAELELRPGGKWRFVQRNEDGSETGFRGVYREVSAPERLVYTFEWEGMPGHVLIDTATFEDLGERTRVLVHSLFHTSEERDGMLSSGMERGLDQSYAMLDELLAESAPR
jgi:uncharacterized protein YndB with AHSA1/START domain